MTVWVANLLLTVEEAPDVPQVLVFQLCESLFDKLPPSTFFVVFEADSSTFSVLVAGHSALETLDACFLALLNK